MLMETSEATRISTDVPSSPERKNSYVAIPLVSKLTCLVAMAP